MTWNRSLALVLATQTCANCMGMGYTTKATCHCVFRQVFRECFRKYKRCVANPERPTLSKNCFLGVTGRTSPTNSVGFSRRDIEFIADFKLVAKRLLTEEQFAIFELYFLNGQPWRPCCKRLSLERGAFYHAVYLIEQVLGKGFGELQPHALWPVDEYFGTTRQIRSLIFTGLGFDLETKSEPMKFPLKQKAS